MRIICPDTGREIPAEHINVQTDMVLSPFTGKMHTLSKLVEDLETLQRDEEHLAGDPPHGVWSERTIRGERIGAIARHWPTLVFFGIFTTFWNSLLSVFVVGPYIGSPSSNGMKFGQDAFATLFLSPFILVGLGTFFFVVFQLVGKVEVTIDRDDACAFTGVGPFGFKRRFKTSAVRSVVIDESSIRSNDTPMKKIQIEADRSISLGWSLTPARREYLASLLRARLVFGKPDDDTPELNN